MYSHYQRLPYQDRRVWAFEFDEMVVAVVPAVYVRMIDGPFDSFDEASRAHANSYGFARNRGEIFSLTPAQAQKRVEKDLAIRQQYAA